MLFDGLQDYHDPDPMDHSPRMKLVKDMETAKPPFLYSSLGTYEVDSCILY